MAIGWIIAISYVVGVIVYACLHIAIVDTFPRQKLVSSTPGDLAYLMFLWPFIYLTWIFKLVLWTGKVTHEAAQERRKRKNAMHVIPDVPMRKAG